MNPDDFPAPNDGFVLSYFLVVSDQDRSRVFYQSLFDGQVLMERDPVIMKVANTWLILNEARVGSIRDRAESISRGPLRRSRLVCRTRAGGQARSDLVTTSIAAWVTRD